MPPTVLPRTCESFGSQAISQLQSIAAKAAGGTGGRQTPPSKPDPQTRLIDRIDRLAGRLGAFAGGTLVGGVAAATAMARSGFSGTAEGAQLGYQMEQLGRQLAAVFQPVIQGMTYAARQFDRALRNMDGGGQDRLLGGMLGTGLGMAFGGLPGAALGGLMGSRLMGGDADAGLGIGAGAAGFMGARYLGASRLAALGTGALAAAPFALAGAGEKYETRLRTEISRDLGMPEDSRTVRLATWLGKVGGGIREGIAALTGRETGPEPGPAGGAAEKPRREVSLFQAETLGAGQAYFELQKGVLRATAGAGEDGGPLQPVIDIGLEIIRLLGIVADVDVKFTDPADSVKGSHVGFVAGAFDAVAAAASSLLGRK